MFDDLTIYLFITREDQLQHHEIGQENVRRVGGDALAGGGLFLTGVALYSELARCGAKVVQKLAHFLKLAVRERVHRVDDDRAGARSRVGGPLAQDAVEDGDKKCE